MLLGMLQLYIKCSNWCFSKQPSVLECYILYVVAIFFVFRGGYDKSNFLNRV